MGLIYPNYFLYRQDLCSFIDLIKNYDENNAIISVFLGFQRAYKAPNQEIKKSRNQRYECHLGIHRVCMPFRHSPPTVFA